MQRPECALQGSQSKFLLTFGPVAARIEALEVMSFEPRTGESPLLVIQHLNQRIGGPGRVVDTGLHVAVKAGVRPVDRMANPAVFDRVAVDVMKVDVVIRRAADRVFPEASLPDAAFAGFLPAGRAVFVRWQTARKRGFDQPPAR